jgi:hypothetical protein
LNTTSCCRILDGACSLGDLFNDGHQEALVNSMNERQSLYFNTAPIGNFFSLHLVGVKSNRAALGIVVTLEQGSDKHEKEIRSGNGYISQSDPWLHFGLDQAAKAAKIVTCREPIITLVREGSGLD